MTHFATIPSITLASVPPLRLKHDIGQEPGGFLERVFFRGSGVSEAAKAADGLYMLIFWFSVFFFVLLMTLTVYWAIKYRRRPGVPPPRSSSHNTLLEVFWTVVPSSSLIVIFVIGFWTYMEHQVPRGGGLDLVVQGYKWGWNITYPGGENPQWTLPTDAGNNYEVPVFVVPEDTYVNLRMNSSDVMHSFWIPDLRVKMDLFPNRYSGYSFKTPKLPPTQDGDLDETGVDYVYSDHWVFCAEYCGDLHSEMAAIMRVVPKNVYASTLDSWDLGNKSLCEIGESVWAAQCRICHSVDGSAGTGPTWKNAWGYDRPLADGTSVEFDADYARESILYPGAKIHRGYANQMPSFQGILNDQQLDGLIAYIESLSDRGRSCEEQQSGGMESEGGEPGEEGTDGEMESEGGGGDTVASLGD